MMRSSGVDYWDRLAEAYDGRTAFLNAPMPPMIARAEGALRGRKRVLEVAAGTGLVTEGIAGVCSEVVATDYSENMVRMLEKRLESKGIANVTCARADLYALPFPEAHFDAVLAANVLHLVDDLPRALACLGRVLAPGGALLVPTFCHAETVRAQILSRLMGLTGFRASRRLSARSLCQAVVDAGFEVTDTATFAGPLPLVFVAARRAAIHGTVS
jgi:phosphatidylethanolamine/phosphatidyl-N-methylethanolamine N-methyltransferase